MLSIPCPLYQLVAINTSDRIPMGRPLMGVGSFPGKGAHETGDIMPLGTVGRHARPPEVSDVVWRLLCSAGRLGLRIGIGYLNWKYHIWPWFQF
jgi:hypothetical protein